MKNFLTLALISLCGFSASAYQDGTFNCKNRNAKLPDNVYKVQTLSVGGLSVPHVDATLYYFSTSGDVNSPVASSHLQGFASISSSQAGVEVLQISALSLTFEKDQFMNCKP